MKIDEQTNVKRHQLLEDTIFEMEEHWAIPRETTGIVLTAFIGKFRRTLEDGSFEVLARELFEVVKDIPSSYDKYTRNQVDERGTPFDEGKYHRNKRGHFCKPPSPLDLGAQNKS